MFIPYFLMFVTAFYTADALNLPKNCEDVQLLFSKRLDNVKSGTFKIYPTHTLESEVEVFCDMDTSGGGWTVIQQRSESEPQIDFYRTWEQYAVGFGIMGNDFWLGLDVISKLTTADNYALRIDMMDWNGTEAFAEYEFFQVANSESLYKLTIRGFQGDAGDSLAYHNGMNFSTKDRDNDNRNGNCAVDRIGAWWYNNCNHSHLNGRYGIENGDDKTGVYWNTWGGYNHTLKRVQMKIRTQCFNKMMNELYAV